MKIDATDPRCPEWTRLLLPCAASDYHYLTIDWWDDDPAHLMITPTFWRPTLWGRVKGAVKVLFGREFNHADGVILDSETLDDLVLTLLAAPNKKKAT